MVGDGIPGCNAPIGFIDALTFPRSVRRRHLLDFFFIPKIEFQGEQGCSVCFNSSCVSIRSSVQFSSVHFSRSVLSDSLRPHELQHTRPPYPSPTPGVHSDSRPSSPWCHPAISSSVVPFSSCLSQHEGLFKWVSSSHQAAKVLEFQLQRQTFQLIFRSDFL